MHGSPVLVLLMAGGMTLTVACAEELSPNPGRAEGEITSGDPSSPGPDPIDYPGNGSSSGGSSGGSSSGASSSGASSTSSGGSSTSSSGGAAGGTCSVTIEGGEGGDDGSIPVCCTPPATQRSKLDELFTLLNEYRASQGKSALVYDDALEAAMQGHCDHMVKHGFFNHMAPEASVRTPGDRAAKCKTTILAENLAGGQSSPAAVMASWKSSPDHDANMLGPYGRVGFCRAGNYWGQAFR